MISGSLLGGLGNLANAVLLYLFQGQQTSQAIPQAITQAITQATPRALAGSQMMTAQSLPSFLVVSFIIGTLMILLVFVSARLIIRVRGRKIVEEEEQQPSD
jgi:prolipoprotein diacylglyceryltransferase